MEKLKSIPQHSTVSVGTAIEGNGNGWWVCIKTHVFGKNVGLKPGESNDLWHWSVGKS